MKHVGKTFLFEFEPFAVKAHYVSETKMRWEQTRGPAAGSHDEEEYHCVEVRPDVLFLSWQEKNTSVVAQVVDFAKGVVHTTYVSPEKQVYRLQGTVQRASD
ncbi:MAG: MoaF-related domain-containing protein [Candidatus Acidiferrales bacterium]